MIRFDSDYIEGCHPAILARMAETNMEQTVGYGCDPHCDRARALIKSACGREDVDVHFLVGGTQANATVISSILKPYQGVVCSCTGHIGVHETGAIEHGGHKVLAIPGPDSKLSASAVEKLFHSHFNDPSWEHTVQPGMVYLSFSNELGLIYTLEELKAIKTVCDKWHAPLFIDGARLGYGLAAPGGDVTLQDIAQIADIFYIGGTKQGALFGEAVVIVNDSLKKDFRYHIKQNGGMLAKGRLLGIQFETLFEDGLYMQLAKHADDMASLIRDGFKAKGYEFLTDSPTNQVFPILSMEKVEELQKEFGFETWQEVGDMMAVRFCTSWCTPRENVEALLKAI